MGIRSRYEQLGLEAVPGHLKTTKASDYIRIQAAVAVNAGNFLVPALAVLEGGLSFYAAVLCTMAGAAFAFFFVSLLALPGAKYGLPAQYVIRTMIGTKGSKYLASPVRSITSLYWFGVQTVGGTYILKELLERGFGLEVPFVLLSLPLALIMAYLAVVGFEAIKKVSRFALPVMAAAAVIMLGLFFTGTYDGLSASEAVADSGNWSLPVMVLFASLAFVQYVSGAGTSSDMARYAKSSRQAVTGIYAGNVLGFFITAVLGAFTAAVAGEWNPFVASTRLTESPLLIGAVAAAAFSSMIIINLNNAYTGGFSLLNTFPALGRIRSAVMFGAAGVVVSCFPVIVNDADRFISMLGTVVIPLTAVFIADFLFVKRGRLTPEQLSDRVHTSFNRTGGWAALSGVFVYLAVPDIFSPSFVSFFFTMAVYVIINRMNTDRKKVKVCA
ncbi:purine-cytosine permease family protein [Alteribacter lacisalsi]|uniref:purine-cytosine permease family protein n=1 Tax=Alteribacter lacisalsi TaxID=2045244 RepID=UPI001F009F38|nr:cytosine permease [Alteribacter lacisalsi]